MLSRRISPVNNAHQATAAQFSGQLHATSSDQTEAATRREGAPVNHDPIYASHQVALVFELNFATCRAPDSLTSEPEEDGCSERYGREEDDGAPVVSCRNPPPVFEPAEHGLDTVAALVATFIVADGFLPALPAGDVCLYLLVLQRISEPVGIIVPVGQHPLRLRQAAQHGSCTGGIADGASGDEHAYRTALSIGYGMKLRVHSTFRAPDQPPTLPFFTRRLEAVRWTFR